MTIFYKVKRALQLSLCYLFKHVSAASYKTSIPLSDRVADTLASVPHRNRRYVFNKNNSSRLKMLLDFLIE